MALFLLMNGGVIIILANKITSFIDYQVFNEVFSSFYVCYFPLWGIYGWRWGVR